MLNGWWCWWCKKKLMLMVGFNCCFVLLYCELKMCFSIVVLLCMDKYCIDSIGLYDLCFILFDDYLYVVDIVLWLVGGEVCFVSGMLFISEFGEMCYVEYYFFVDKL